MNEKIIKIKEGVVIDHIEHGKVKDVITILNLDANKDVSYTLGVKHESSKIGNKDFLKIENINLNEDELNKIALISPNVTINLISDYNIINKRKVELPNFIQGIVKCFNPNCITRYEDVKTKFYVVNQNPLILRCHYCEKSSSKIELI
ncbi:aspartate carbamoyltransferase regulatory subunit [archaeon]|nr:aspartate carbamoyltransferase regulatory subunit [archaeon]